MTAIDRDCLVICQVTEVLIMHYFTLGIIPSSLQSPLKDYSI